jgi:hypothetical protein
MKFSCEKCFYYTDSKFCFENHKKSKNHIKRETNEYQGNFECKICNKTYKSYCGYYNHHKICESKKKIKDEEENERKRKYEEEIRKIIIDLYKQNTEIINKNNEIINKNNEIIKENSEMKNLLVEISKKENNITNIENNTNSKNKIDINVFLNDKCKNAINMSSLIESIVIGIKDIENIEKHGYVKTITNIVAEKLGDYSIYERPLHYYIENEKNEEPPNDTIHIKENGEWNEEDLYEHDLLLENLNTLNNAFQENTKKNELMNLVVKNGKRYDRTKKIITNILDNVKINEEQLC